MDFDVSIVTDLEFIRSILEDESVKDGFCGGSDVTQENIDRCAGIFFHVKNVGLFAANVMGRKELMFHAAIPKENRGIEAVRAAKQLGNKLVEMGFTVKTKQRDIRHQRVFVKMVGFEFLEAKDGFNYYIYRGNKDG